MGKIGQTIENPLTGERVTFLQTTQSTGGTLLEVECAIPGPGFGPPLHVHLKQKESFRVVAGKLGVVGAGEQRLLGIGETAGGPPPRARPFLGGGGRKEGVVVTK